MSQRIYNALRELFLRNENYDINNDKEHLQLVDKVYSIVSDRYKNKSPEKIDTFVTNKCNEKIQTFIDDKRILESLMGSDAPVENNTNINTNTELSIEDTFKRLAEERGLSNFQNAPTTKENLPRSQTDLINSSSNNIDTSTTTAAPKEYYDIKQSEDRLKEFLDSRNHTNDNIVDKPEELVINREEIDNKLILDESSQEQASIRYDINVPKTIAEGHLIDASAVRTKEPKLIIIDSENISNGGELSFEKSLMEKLKLDTSYDMVLEFLTLQNIANLERNNLLFLDFDKNNGNGQVSIGTYTNVQAYQDKFIFPNETFGFNDSSEGAGESSITNGSSYTIKLKNNYMGTISAGEYSSFNITLSGNYDATATPTSTSALNTLLTSGNGRMVLGILLK